MFSLVAALILKQSLALCSLSFAFSFALSLSLALFLSLSVSGVGAGGVGEVEVEPGGCHTKRLHRTHREEAAVAQGQAGADT